MICCFWIAYASAVLAMESDTVNSAKRSRITVDRAEADSSNIETSCGDGDATQAMGNKGDTYGEIIGERVIMPHS